MGNQEENNKKFEKFSKLLLKSDFIIYKKQQKDNFDVSSKRVGQIFFTYEENIVKARFNYDKNGYIDNYSKLSASSKMLNYLDYIFCDLLRLAVSKPSSIHIEDKETEDMIKSIELITYFFSVFIPQDQDIKVFLMRYLDFVNSHKFFDIVPSQKVLTCSYQSDAYVNKKLLDDLDKSFNTLKGIYHFWKYTYPKKSSWIVPEYPPTSDLIDKYLKDYPKLAE